MVQSNSNLRALGQSVVELLRDQVLAVQLRSGHLSKNERSVFVKSTIQKSVFIKYL